MVAECSGVGDLVRKGRSARDGSRASRRHRRGVLILSEIMSVFDRATCLVSEADILDGLVASLR